MKFFATFAFLALFAVAFAQSQPVEAGTEKKVEPVATEPQVEPQPDGPRDKRGVLLGASYTAPIAYTGYTAYSAPYVYSAPYAYPYAYHYKSYPYVYHSYY